ncbi:hypothetical protein Q8A67_012575 [Cirrhinus molitorella]|uniref:Uncharacterized protein n=1 Tax=Cirrhinus molitorella TaxID=172907 RepID=A0AA88PPI1_9TELE|nr:hypothetical protein Q8A67_012575 [Cirrhinus molitorella]
MSNILHAASKVRWNQSTAAKRAVFLAAAAYGAKTLYPIICKQINQRKTTKNNTSAPGHENGLISAPKTTPETVSGLSKSPGVNAEFFKQILELVKIVFPRFGW